MGLIFKVGDHEHFPPKPKNFPTCGSWLPEDDDADDNGDRNALDNDLSLSTDGTPSDAALIKSMTPTHSTYQDNVIAHNKLVNGTLSHSESQPNFEARTTTTAGSVQLQAFSTVVYLAAFSLLSANRRNRC